MRIKTEVNRSQEGLQNLERAQEKQKDVYDLKRSGPSCNVGDKVLNRNARKDMRMGRKLEERFVGPFFIREVLAKGAFFLWDDNLTHKVNGSNLRRVISPIMPSAASLSKSLPPSPPTPPLPSWAVKIVFSCGDPQTCISTLENELRAFPFTEGGKISRGGKNIIRHRSNRLRSTCRRNAGSTSAPSSVITSCSQPCVTSSSQEMEMLANALKRKKRPLAPFAAWDVAEQMDKALEFELFSEEEQIRREERRLAKRKLGSDQDEDYEQDSSSEPSSTTSSDSSPPDSSRDEDFVVRGAGRPRGRAKRRPTPVPGRARGYKLRPKRRKQVEYYTSDSSDVVTKLNATRGLPAKRMLLRGKRTTASSSSETEGDTPTKPRKTPKSPLAKTHAKRGPGPPPGKNSLSLLQRENWIASSHQFCSVYYGEGMSLLPPPPPPTWSPEHDTVLRDTADRGAQVHLVDAGHPEAPAVAARAAPATKAPVGARSRLVECVRRGAMSAVANHAQVANGRDLQNNPRYLAFVRDGIKTSSYQEKNAAQQQYVYRTPVAPSRPTSVSVPVADARSISYLHQMERYRKPVTYAKPDVLSDARVPYSGYQPPRAPLMQNLSEFQKKQIAVGLSAQPGAAFVANPYIDRRTGRPNFELIQQHHLGMTLPRDLQPHGSTLQSHGSILQSQGSTLQTHASAQHPQDPDTQSLSSAGLKRRGSFSSEGSLAGAGESIVDRVAEKLGIADRKFNLAKKAREI
ncbi:unnamed protein product [Darwinula stevensoni]|uniref:Uncharacterized protein n=1 Tax=Darwinula stevensoni TaxID=69355 RepID=A0A7R9FT31_9CRUS|nr:unnamed protein product [Darwinula stevensoni]CAG0904374.1 unnamed protein product [Darwinula stevensoni]